MTRQNLDSTCTESGLDLYRFWTRCHLSRSFSGLDKTAQSLSVYGLDLVSTHCFIEYRFWTPLLLPTESVISIGRAEGAA